MTLKPMSRSVSIIGVGATRFGDPSDTPELGGSSLQDMAAAAAMAAMEDAGVNPRQIGKCVLGMTCSSFYNSNCFAPNFGFGEFIGMKGKASSFHSEGCASGYNAFNEAVDCVASGRSDIAICVDTAQTRLVNAPNQPSCYRYPAADYKKLYGRDLGAPGPLALDTAYVKWAGSYFVTQFDGMSRQYMKDNRITPEQLEDAYIGASITAREHGKLNPIAYARTTWEEEAKKRGFDDVKAYLKSQYNPLLSEYMRVAYFILQADGAAAVIVCASDMAGRFKQQPIEVVNIVQSDMSALTPNAEAECTREAAKQLYEVTGYRPEDIEYLQTGESDMSGVLDSAEAVGYLPKGEGWKYFRDGRTRFDKDKPINTDGGSVGVGHAFGSTPVEYIMECVLQMRGQGGARQIPKPPRVVMLRGFSAIQTASVAIFRTLEPGARNKPQAEPSRHATYRPVVKSFYEGLDKGKFLGMKCPTCGNVEFPPYPVCNKCGHIGNEWVELSGDVTVNEAYRLYPALVTPDLAPYAPIFGANVTLAEGTVIGTLLFGVTPETYEKTRDSVPLKGKLVALPMEGFNSFAVGINGAVPIPKGGEATGSKHWDRFVKGRMDQMVEEK